MSDKKVIYWSLAGEEMALFLMNYPLGFDPHWQFDKDRFEDIIRADLGAGEETIAMTTHVHVGLGWHDDLLADGQEQLRRMMDVNDPAPYKEITTEVRLNEATGWYYAYVSFIRPDGSTFVKTGEGMYEHPSAETAKQAAELLKQTEMLLIKATCERELWKTKERMKDYMIIDDPMPEEDEV